MLDEEKLRRVRDTITDLLDEYLQELRAHHDDDDDEPAGNLVTEWVAVIGSTRIEWTDGRQSITMIHSDVPYSARLGLLTSAQHDLVSI